MYMREYRVERVSRRPGEVRGSAPGELDQVRGHAQAEGQGLLHHDVGACFQGGADALRVLVLGHDHVEEVDPACQQGVNRCVPRKTGGDTWRVACARIRVELLLGALDLKAERGRVAIADAHHLSPADGPPGVEVGTAEPPEPGQAHPEGLAAPHGCAFSPRVTLNGPTKIVSMPGARRKHSIASPGDSAIGMPSTLRLVLSTAGVPLACVNNMIRR